MCDDGRTNINLCEPLAVYPVESDDGIGMVIYAVTRGDDIGDWMLYVPAEDMAQLGEGQCLLATSGDGFVTVFWMNGTMLVYAGPDDEGKVFVFIYHSFPGVPSFETYFGSAPDLAFPNCID
jgi:hypothetical protein